jgi:hypothetical protein
VTSPVTESQLTAAILDALSRCGRGLFWRNNTGKLQDNRGRWVSFGLGIGSPDIVGIIRCSVIVSAPMKSDLAHVTDFGRFVGLEVKTDTGKLSPEQSAWHAAASKAGALVAVVTSVREALDVVGAP